MQHRLLIGIPFALAMFVFFNALGFINEGRVTRRNVLISLAGAVVYYALGAIP